MIGMAPAVALFRTLLTFIVGAWCCPTQYTSHRKAYGDITKLYETKQIEDPTCLKEANKILMKAMGVKKFKNACSAKLVSN